MGKRAKTQQAGGRTGRILGRLGLLAAETLLLAFVALCALSFVLAKGPSPSAAREFVLTVRETRALRFLAGWFFSDAEIAQMEAGKNAAIYAETDTSLIRISADPSEPDAWGLVDEDGDGIVWEEIQGKGFQGCMMVVREPSRVVLGFRPDESGTVGQTARHYGAVAGVKAGGTSDTLVVFQGEIFSERNGTGGSFAGFDGDYVLHVGRMTAAELQAADIQYGVGSGPALVVNGEAVDSRALASGYHACTAIGQRADGAVLLLVIDSARYQDLARIMLAYGAVNACSMAGGSSSPMVFNGAYIRKQAFVGEAKSPTAWLVLEEGARLDD